MSPSAPVIVQPSCVQTASIAVNALALVRDTRNAPAIDWTSAAPPTSVNAVPATVTRTAAPVNTPALTPSVDGTPPPPDGEGEADDDDPLQDVSSVDSVTVEAT